MSDLIKYFLAAAFIQNMVLMTGFGSSVLVRMSRKRRNLLPFSALLCIFAFLTVLICYPLDALIGTSVFIKWLRPTIIIMVTALLYVGTSILLKKKLPTIYKRVKRMLPLAAFNNLVVGIALIGKLAISLTGALGMALGACVGFLLLLVLTTEGIERLDNPDVPKAFRGLPSLLIYLGIIALSLMGFSGSVSLI